MGKRITISEGGVGRRFGPESTLTTKLAAGGKQVWIPEDEANNYASQAILTVTQNGEYAPPVGCYNPVEVNVNYPMGSLQVTENGTYEIDENDEIYGWSDVEVDVDTAGKFFQLVAHANAEWDASDIGINGYSSVVVNVDNGVHLTNAMFTANGEYSAPEGNNAWRYVTVFVPLDGVTIGQDGTVTVPQGAYSTVINADGSMTVNYDGGSKTIDLDGTVTGHEEYSSG